MPDQIQKSFESLLAPYAVSHTHGLGRTTEEIADTTRLPFQRDRGRIVHTQEFRRLKGKTQVFVGGGGDHFRTRLTHTLEVAGVSRDIARALQLNEDLAECIALAHDLGHPPFGHAGEEALNTWMGASGSRFEHNMQSYRIVTKLAHHCDMFQGLNLNQEVLDGLLKHYTPHDHPEHAAIERNPSLEAQVVNIADEIAYTAHDCEDGLNAKLFSKDNLLAVEMVRSAYAMTEERGSSLRGAIIHILVTDLYESTAEHIQQSTVKTIDDVYAYGAPVVIFSSTIREQLDALRTFLWDKMYNHPSVLQRSEAGQSILLDLCKHYEEHPSEKILEYQKKYDESPHQAIVDYIAGMTDAYAFLQAEKEGVVSDVIENALS